jgi:TolB protein
MQTRTVIFVIVLLIITPNILLADGARQLTIHPASDRHPCWSPDGLQIAFQSDRAGSRDIFVMPATGPTVMQVTSGHWDSEDPSWCGDGSRIGYSQSGSLYCVPTAGGEPQQLTCGNADHAPSWCSVGCSIAYQSELSGNGDIWMIEVATGATSQLTSHPGRDWYPAISPDVTQIAFQSDRSGSFDIWVMSTSGTDLRQLTSGPGHEAHPTWSPDGRFIAFYRYQEGDANLWIVPADGGMPMRITRHPALDLDPAWAPDGSAIVFSSNRSGNMDLWLIDVGATAVEPATWGAIKAAFR